MIDLYQLIILEMTTGVLREKFIITKKQCAHIYQKVLLWYHGKVTVSEKNYDITLDVF